MPIDDLEFAEPLNRLRHNELTPEDKQTLAQRQIAQGCPQYPISAPHFFIENTFVDNFNDNLMKSLPTTKVDVKADTGVLSETKMSLSVKQNLVRCLRENQASTGQLKNTLTLAESTIYDISLNIYVSDGLTNGATCVLQRIQYKDSTTRPAIVCVLFSDCKIGTLQRNQYRHAFNVNVDPRWTPIFETKRTCMYI